jgi:uncharacterized protein YjiS (DUF1127 family)
MTSALAKRPIFFTKTFGSISHAPVATTAAALVQVVRQIVVAIKRRRALARLAELDDRMLADVGLRRSDLYAASRAPLWQDPTSIAVRNSPWRDRI